MHIYVLLPVKVLDGFKMKKLMTHHSFKLFTLISVPACQQAYVSLHAVTVIKE